VRRASPALAGFHGVQVTEGIDLADEAAVGRFYGSIPRLWASIHCAGSFDMQPIATAQAADLERMWRANVVTAYLCCREAVRAIGRSGEGGRIVNVAARAGLEPRAGAGMAAYAASKAAVAALTVALAAELAGEPIRVNAIAPAILDTPANRAAMPRADRSGWAELADVAAVIGFLVAPGPLAVNGAVIPVPGGS
jgi:NAD(P)-dependent dehydrogenase (short-subunit alcohol dehydrogenase family)